MSRDDIILILATLSLLCALILLGLWRYSGSILPAVTGSSAVESASMWVVWGILVGLPIMTVALVLFRILKGNDTRQ